MPVHNCAALVKKAIDLCACRIQRPCNSSDLSGISFDDLRDCQYSWSAASPPAPQ